MSKLLDYLNLLDANAAARDAHNSDPTAAMSAFGLSAAEQQTFMSGNIAAIANLAGIAPEDFPKLNVTNAEITY